MRIVHRAQAADPRLRAGDQGQPRVQHAAGPRRDQRRRASGLHWPRPRPVESRLRRVAGADRLMADFLLELLSEEIPARMQAKARNDLARLFAECTGEAGLETGPIDFHSTPRRLVLIARDVAPGTKSAREEIKGPRSSAPPQALEGFLKKTGLTRDQLEERDGVLFAVIERAGRSAADVLAETVKRIVADFPWPKSMRWGDGSQRWVRPLHGIVAMLGDAIATVHVDGIASGASTVGHRFHHPG